MPRPRLIKDAPVEAQVEADSILSTNLSAIVAQFEAILKPYQNKIAVTVDKANGVVQTIGMTITISNPR